MDYNFDMEFMTDTELEQAMDELVESVRDNVENDENKTTVLNVLRLKQLQFAYAVLKYITKDKDAQLSYKLYEPFKTMGSITVEGKVLAFDKPEWFARVAEFATNTEIYPLAKNVVRMTFTFHGLTSTIE